MSLGGCTQTVGTGLVWPINSGFAGGILGDAAEFTAFFSAVAAKALPKFHESSTHAREASY